VAGDIAEVGSEVTRVGPSERVVVNPRLTCGQCRYCIAGDEELCLRPGMLGVSTNGGYAEYVTVPAVNVVAIPDTMSYEQAASLPTVFIPSWSMLMRRAALKPW
jgi:D-arabinose 1-dehydrogenase-like Zn-dependent alcohol dehydrogenase